MGTALKEFHSALKEFKQTCLAQHWARDWRALALKELLAGPLDRSDRAAKVKQKARRC